VNLLQPNHDEAWHTPSGRFIREVLFGMNDGLVSTIGFVAGVTAAVMQSRIVLLTGLAEVVAGALSMAIGAYLATKAQREFFEHEIRRERREIEEVPEREAQEIREIFTHLGFLPDEVEMIVRRVTSDKELWVRFMLREELGILEETFDDPKKVGVIMGGSFAVGGAVPILPYFFLDDVHAGLWAAVALSLLFLFGIGVGKSRLTKIHWLRSGLEILALGSLAAGLGYLIGMGIGLLV
jgi:predicted membrane protein (TIGR00267 family)